MPLIERNKNIGWSWCAGKFKDSATRSSGLKQGDIECHGSKRVSFAKKIRVGISLGNAIIDWE